MITIAFIDEQLKLFKEEFEQAIVEGGAKGKESAIRSSSLINLIHDAVKYELIQAGVNPNNIYPQLGETKPEMKIAGLLKQKDQDVCVVPSNILREPTVVDWGPMAYKQINDPYGFEYSTNTLIINVRSQMSSIAKNKDTLFERTFAEAMNLHMRYKDAVLGEVYLIPTHEYDDAEVAKHRAVFKRNPIDLETFISFFDSINGRREGDPEYLYERCTLLIVDFSQKEPKLFRNSAELKAAGLISQDYPIEYANLGFDSFADEILKIYSRRYDIGNLLLV